MVYYQVPRGFIQLEVEEMVQILQLPDIPPRGKELERVTYHSISFD